MAITENEYTGNGSTVLYSFTFPYLEVADIKVSLDGTLTTAYTLANATTVQFNTAPANGVAIRLFRQTNDDALNAQFFPGSAIRSTDLNNNFTQNLYVTQESNRDATQGITTADAATATANTALSNSSAAVSTANTASSNASAAVSTANTASSNASAAVSTANTASSNATTAVSTANAATATANSAASDAATAISTANSALSTANTASTTATNAVNTANSASSAASSAVSTANTASSNASAAVSTANTASSNATSAVNTANSALSTANAAASAVANAILYDIVANVAAIPASPANNDAVEVIDSTGIESFTPLTSIPGGFAGNSGLSVRIVYTTTGNTWTWIQYFPNDPETRYLKEAVTTSDTAPVSPSDGDLWYDSVGGRTYVYYDDGDTSQWVDTSPQGSGVSDAISEGNTSAEVIDTGSDGRFVVTTEGSERLRVDPSGRLGIGTTTPQSPLTVGATTDFGAIVKISRTDANFNSGMLVLGNGNSTDNYVGVWRGDANSVTTGGQYLNLGGYDGIVFAAGASALGAQTERLRIDNSGRLGIGTSDVKGALGLQHGNTSPQGLTDVAIDALRINQGVGGSIAIRATQYDSINQPAAGDTQFFNLFYNGSTYNWYERMRITAEGRLGIGTTSPSRRLQVGDYNGGNAIEISTNSTSNGGIFFADGNTGTSTYPGYIEYNHSADAFVFATANNERVRIDSSGRLLVGMSTAPSTGSLQYSKLFLAGNTVGNGSSQIALTRREAFNGLGSGQDLGFVYFGTYDGGNYGSIACFSDGASAATSTPGRLTFSTTAAGASNPTERMRISQNGSVAVRSTGNYPFVSNSSSAPGTTATIFAGNCNATDLVGTGATTVFIVYNNGNVQNTNNSYTGISDIKLKENVVDANSQWDDLKALQVRNYNFKEGQTHTQIGLVAQEVELVSPGLVSESPDRDEDGNDLGTVTKSVNYSVLYMKAVKALQEAMTRIETLEAANTDLAARLTALEGGTN
jgi:hypothetical protein